MMSLVLYEVAQERENQDIIHGKNSWPDGTGYAEDHRRAEQAKDITGIAARVNELTWRDILTEEFYEALAETDPQKLREELIQVAAVAVAWIEDIRFKEGLE